MRTFVSCIGLAIALAQPALAHAADDSGAQAIAEYFKPLGPVTKRKTFHNSARTQRIEYFCVDENLPGGARAGQKNPKNVRCGAALFVYASGRWVYGDEIELGYGSVQNFTDYRLEAQELAYGEDDDICCPTAATNRIYTTRQGKLTEDRAAEEALELNAPAKRKKR